jgi:hypothetical protein
LRANVSRDEVVDALRRGPTLLGRVRIRLTIWRNTHREVWSRHDVAGHDPGCTSRPTVVHGGGLVLRCDCWASSWRRR